MITREQLDTRQAAVLRQLAALHADTLVLVQHPKLVHLPLSPGNLRDEVRDFVAGAREFARPTEDLVRSLGHDALPPLLNGGDGFTSVEAAHSQLADVAEHVAAWRQEASKIWGRLDALP